MAVDRKLLNDEDLASIFSEAKKMLDQYEEEVSEDKKELLARLAEKGVALEQSPITGTPTKKIIETSSFKILNEGRRSYAVNNQQAVLLFMSKGWQDDIEIKSSISLRGDVEPKDVPIELISQMKKYFNIETVKIVDEKAILAKKEENLLTDAEAKSCLNEKITNVLKVIKK